MPTHTVPEAEVILDRKYPVHNKGGIALIGYMGSDKAIEEAARVSYIGSEEEERTPEQRRGLIRYLLSHRHTTPFEQVELKFRVKAPMFVWRQWIRHRTASVNEISGRYSVLPEDWYVPEADQICLQSTSSKQGRSEQEVVDAKQNACAFDLESSGAFDTYNARLDNDMAKELARINLPLSTYTEAIWKIDLHNLFHFLGLRAHSHAQYEIRAYTEPMIEMVKAVCPLAYEAFEDYVLNAVRFSSNEQDLLALVVQGKLCVDDVEERLSTSTGRRSFGFAQSPGEANEFLNKLTALTERFDGKGTDDEQIT